MNAKQSGITLLELMIVVAIVGVLAAIAYPSYRDQMRRSNRSEAKIAIEQTAGALEKCYTRYMMYNDNANCAASNQFNAGAGFNTSGGFYRITGVVAGTTFTLTATPQGGQATDSECMNFTLTEAGARGVSGSASATPDRCW